jgi:hypothetical protein
VYVVVRQLEVDVRAIANQIHALFGPFPKKQPLPAPAILSHGKSDLIPKLLLPTSTISHSGWRAAL